jgi:UDP-glucose-4-epimerase GalE
MRNVLVTGGAGYIGSHTSKLLAKLGCNPVTLDNLSMGHRWAVRYGPLVEADLSDIDATERALEQHQIEAVVHFAANAYVGESVRDPGKYFQNNVANSLNLLNAMVRTGVRRIVFSSTCATYGNPTRLPLDEEHPQQPINPYGESKLFIEKALRWYAEAHNIQWCSLRYFNAAGADPDGELGEAHDPETHLIPLTIQAALGVSGPVRIFGTDYATPDGTAIRDFIHVMDLASAHAAALDYLEAGGQNRAINLGTGKGHSVREIMRAVEETVGTRVPVQEAPRREGDPAVLVANPDRARRELGWRPRLSDLKTIIGTACQWESRLSPALVAAN